MRTLGLTLGFGRAGFSGGGPSTPRLPAPLNPTAVDNGDGTFAYSFSAITPGVLTLSRYEYQLNNGAYKSLLLATSGNITDAGYVNGPNTIRFRGYDASANVAGFASETVSFNRGVVWGDFLDIGDGSGIDVGDGTPLAV